MTAPNLLSLLEETARHDLVRLNYPPANWVPGAATSSGAPLLDVLIIGAGMCGQSAAFACLREGMRNLRIIDKAPYGEEGPWGTFARMETLRSPKTLTSPDLGIASLTFRAWYEAQYGADGWEALYKIPVRHWLDYLLWVRRIAGVPVENDTALSALAPMSGPDAVYMQASLNGPQGNETVFARKVVLALGRDGSGAPRWPRFARFDPASAGLPGENLAPDNSPPTAKPASAGVRRAARVFHSAEDIDFAALRGKRVAVLGAGSSAFDNAGTALEAGAGAVEMFARRPFLPQVNKSKWASFPGFFHGFVALDDAMKWKIFTYIFSEQVPPPFESVLRCDKHAQFTMRLGEGAIDLVPGATHTEVITLKGRYAFDAVIVATGFDVDMMSRPEVAAFREHVLVWADRVSAEQAQAFPEESRFPYLGDGFQLLERAAGAMPAAANLHIFNWGCTLSHGQLAGDIPGVGTGATRLARALARDLFVAEQARLYEGLLNHAEPELKPTRYYVPSR